MPETKNTTTRICEDHPHHCCKHGKFFGFFLISLALFAFLGFYVWKYFDSKNNSKRYITVIGQSSQSFKNELAQYTVTVDNKDEDKKTAIEMTNSVAETLFQKLEEFGIPKEDVKTSYFSVYQEEIYKPGAEPVKGKWRATSTIEIKARDIEKANSLPNIFAQIELSNISGPNYMIDQFNIDQSSLLKSAVENAAQKAQELAKNTGGTLGKVISLTEGYSSMGYPVYTKVFDASSSGFGGAGIAGAPGSTQTVATVTIVYEVN